LNIFKVISQEFVQVLIEVILHGYYEPLHVHLEEKKESEKAFTSENYRLIFQHLGNGRNKVLIILQGVIQFCIGLGQSYVKHCYESLLNSWWPFQKSERELLARKGFKYGREKGCI
jgi:hypothetical protein